MDLRWPIGQLETCYACEHPADPDQQVPKHLPPYKQGYSVVHHVADDLIDGLSLSRSSLSLYRTPVTKVEHMMNNMPSAIFLGEEGNRPYMSNTGYTR